MNKLRLALLSLAAFVAIILGWASLRNPAPEQAFGARTNDRSASPEIAAMRRAIERTIAGAPDYAAFFDRLKGAFPGEYQAFLAHAAERSAAAGETADADALIIEAARGLRQSHGILAAQADGPALDHYFDARLAVLQALAEKDKALCVDFLYGGGSGDFTSFSRDHRDLVAALTVAGLDAVNDGQAKRMKRDAPTDEDFRSLENALRAQGVSNGAIEALLDGKALSPPLDDDEMCQASKTYLQTIAALPDAARRRIYSFAVELMARS